MTERRYEIGDEVYLSTDEQQRKRLITVIHLYPGSTVYGLVCGTEYSEHYEIELSPDKNIEFI